MIEPKELVDFRKQWKQELTASDLQETVSDAQPRTSSSKCVSVVDKRNYTESDGTPSGSVSHSQCQVKPDTRQSEGRTLPKRSWDCVADIREQSNVLQPFLIAENLLKGESGLESLVGARGTVRLSLSVPGSSPTSAPSETVGGSLGRGVTSKADERPAKRQKTGSSETEKPTFLDLFLNDLNEINEIPFFELDVPREVAIRIFHFLDVVELCRCSQVSKAWKSLADDELLWCRISHKLGNGTTLTTTERHGWKEAVREHIIREKSLQQNWKNRVGHVEELQHVIGGVLCAASSHKHLIVAGYNSCQLKIWDRQEGDSWTLHPSTTALVLDEGLDIGMVNNYVSTIGLNDHITAAGYNQGFVDVWNNTGQTSPVHSFSCSGPISALCCSKTEPLLVIAYRNCVRVEGQERSGDDWTCVDVADFQEKVSQLKLLSRPGSGTRSTALVTAVLSDSVYVYPACTGHGHMTAIYDVIGHPVSCIDGDGTDLAVGVSAFDDLSNVYKLKMFDLAMLRESMTFRGHQWRITSINMADSPTTTFVTGCADKMVRVYDRRLPEPVICFTGHSRAVTTVQMDDWKVVSGAQDGLLCVWDQRMVTRLWDVHNRHPVGYQNFEDNLLVWGNVPQEKCPETDGLDNMVHRRYRGSLHVYDFGVTQDTERIPDICQSTYDEPALYNYNIRLTVPYDNL